MLQIERDLALLDRSLEEIRESRIYRPDDPEILSEEILLERLRDAVERRLWEQVKALA